MHDLIIIGAGPAGLTAGLYAGRYRLNAVILEKMVAGGQIILSATIENYPGFPGGIDTQELIAKFKAQVEEVGIRIVDEEALEITIDDSGVSPLYTVKASSSVYQARALLIASGAKYRRLGVTGEERLTGRGVSYCGTCDGPFFKNKEIAVVGGGDRALEEALYLSGYASKVTLIHRRNEFRASKILAEKIAQEPKIEFIGETVVEEVCGQNKVESLKIRNVKTGATSEIVLAGLFVFVGITPETGLVKNLLRLNDQGFIITDRNLATSAPGVFACGDCREKSLYQVVNACGDGAVAADSAHKYLIELKR